MSETSGPKTEELAYLLWEQQGRPENRSAENWLQAEYLAQSVSVLLKPERGENEIDLRMRGLGPLTQSEPSPDAERDADVPPVSSKERSTEEGDLSAPIVTSCIAGAVVALALGVVFSFLRKSP